MEKPIFSGSLISELRTVKMQQNMSKFDQIRQNTPLECHLFYEVRTLLNDVTPPHHQQPIRRAGERGGGYSAVPEVVFTIEFANSHGKCHRVL